MVRADAGESRGCTWRPLRTIIAAYTGGAMHRQERSTPRMSAKFWNAREPKVARLQHLSQKHCPVSRGKLSFRRIIWPKYIAMCAPRARCASPTRYKWDLDD